MRENDLTVELPDQSYLGYASSMLLQAGRPLFCVSAILACKPEVPDPIWRGDHLHYSSTTSAPVCRGSFFRQEEHVVELARMFDFDLSEVIHFTRITSRQVRKYCGHSGLKVGGCAWEAEPYAFAANTSFSFHEISHVVANLAEITGPLAFTEGLAEVFSDGTHSVLSGTPLADVLDGSISSVADYHTAGRFVRFLIERHDIGTLLEFMRRTPREAEMSEYSSLFAEVFGESIDVAMADFSDYPNCSSVSNRIAISDCSLDLQQWSDDTLILTAQVGCERSDVLGPDQSDLMFTSRGFEVAQEGSYALSASASAGISYVRLVKCGSCWDSLERTINAATTEIYNLTPGRYYVTFGRKVTEPAELSLVVERL